MITNAVHTLLRFSLAMVMSSTQKLLVFAFVASVVIVAISRKDPQVERHGTLIDFAAAPAIDLEEQRTFLQVNSNDIPARTALLIASCKTIAPFQSDDKCLDHLLWWINHHPAVQFQGLSEKYSQIILLSRAVKEQPSPISRLTSAWNEAVFNHSSNVFVLRNAAQWFYWVDPPRAAFLLDAALMLDKHDTSTVHDSLILLRRKGKQLVDGANSHAIARRAVHIIQACMLKPQSCASFDILRLGCTAALKSGDYELASEWANLAIDLLLADLSIDVIEFNAHWANNILGIVAMQEGNLPLAEEYLLLSCNIPFSPPLRTIGPEMCLAKELLMRGRRDVVLDYLQRCNQFLDVDVADLWVKSIEKGEIPDWMCFQGEWD